MSEEYSLADALFDSMEAQGFHYQGFSGRVGEEILTFKNDAGEVRTERHGFTPAKPKNMKFSFTGSEFEKQRKKIYDLPPIETIKVDYSISNNDFQMKTVKELLKDGYIRPMTLIFDNDKEITGLLSEFRVDHKEDTEGKFLYDIRHSDEDSGEPATLECNVIVNWFGTLIVDTPIEELENGDKEFLEILDYGYDED